MTRALMSLAVAGVLLTACASGPQRSGPVTPIKLENLFVSPSGEPFHGDMDGPYASAAWFAGADADHDGRLTRAEFMADAMRAFRRFDTNGDGVIDGLEIAAYEDKIAPEIEPRVGRLSAEEGMDRSLFGGRGATSGQARRGRSAKVTAADRELQGAGLYSMLDEPEPISAADADLDGKVTLAEWTMRANRRFDLLAQGTQFLMLVKLPQPEMQKLLERRAARKAAAAR